ncbi:MAG: hypothetical protein V1914_01680 [archaeon]
MTKDLMMITKELEEGKLEILVGEIGEALESVGILKEYFYKGKYQGTEYTALPSQKIDSFHIREDAKEKFTKKILPNQTVMLQIGDKIGWGPGYSIKTVEREMPYDTDPRNKN